jgi:hypothetical protein
VYHQRLGKLEVRMQLQRDREIHDSALPVTLQVGLPRQVTLSRLPRFISSRCFIMLAHVKPTFLVHPQQHVRAIMAEYKRAIQDLRPGHSIHVSTYVLGQFMQQVYPLLQRAQKQDLVLLTGDSVVSAPRQAFGADWQRRYRALERDGVFRAWFAQNIDVPETVFMKALPLGIDFHTQTKPNAWGATLMPREQEAALLRIRSQAKPFLQRKHAVFLDTHLSSSTNPQDRRAMTRALKQHLPQDLIFMLPARLPRQEFWAKCTEHQFVASPLGTGMDCHRTWEMLALGCVPIVKRTTLAPLFEGLPVCLVDSYDDVTPELLARHREVAAIAFHQRRAWIDERMSLAWWDRVIHGRTEVRADSPHNNE